MWVVVSHAKGCYSQMKSFKDMLISLKSSTHKGRILGQGDYWDVSHTCSPFFKVGGGIRTCSTWCAAPLAWLRRELMGSKGSCLQYSRDHYYSVRTNRLRRKTCEILKKNTFYLFNLFILHFIMAEMQKNKQLMS